MRIDNLRHPDFPPRRGAGLCTPDCMALETSTSTSPAPESLDDATLVFADKVVDAISTGDSLLMLIARGA